MIGNQPRRDIEEENWDCRPKEHLMAKGDEACGELVLIGAWVVSEKILDYRKTN